MVLGCDASGPQYLSSRSSDVILSEIRPIQLKYEALRSINTFLDELLWNILNQARSLVTNKIKAEVTKISPTPLGKAALLEAEVELKAYWERTPPNTGVEDATEFPLQWSYELLQLKCEAYSTLNDNDEDNVAEVKLGKRMSEAGHRVPPHSALVGPAALYLTAILEHFCEHILLTISRVVSRDSSRSSATLNDLYVAICEDEQLYETFKSMKVFAQIKNLIKSQPNGMRRSRSIGRTAAEKLTTSSHHSETSLNSGSGHSRSRGSIGDIKAIPGFPVDQRSGSRTSVDNPASTHKRAESAASGCSESLNNSSVELEERILNDEFDELMRSGTTMKVSLTPDRLKTMEVYKEEKSRRVGRKSSNKRGVDELSRLDNRSIGNRPPMPRPVDVIAEDEEEMTATLVSNNARIHPMSSLHKRADPSQFGTNSRTRAISTSQIQTGASHLLPRKTSSLSAKVSIPIPQKRSIHGPSPLELSDKPNRIVRKIGDMDLDDIINGSDDEKSESHTLSNYRTRKPPTISKSARDLIDFLDQGPPSDFSPPLPPQSSAAPSSLKSSGRFQRMMSRLTGSSSSEKLRDESAKLRKTPVINTAFNTNTTNGTTHHPQTPVKKAPNVIVATPPPRMQPTLSQGTPQKSPTAYSDSSRLMQRKTSVRKKVPPLNPDPETPVHNPQSPSVSRTLSDEQIHLSALPSGNGQPNRANEAYKPPQPEPEPQPRASVDTTASGEKIIFRRPAPTPPTKITVEVTASTPLPVKVQPPSPSQDTNSCLNAAHARSLRQLMSTATTADECRVLVDMFLARAGFPIDRSIDEDPYPSPISSVDPSDVDLESSVIETLLGGDASSAPSTTINSAQPSEAGQADESEVGTSDAETGDEVIDSPTRHSPSRIVRDARLNRPLPITRRLLVV